MYELNNIKIVSLNYLNNNLMEVYKCYELLVSNCVTRSNIAFSKPTNCQKYSSPTYSNFMTKEMRFLVSRFLLSKTIMKDILFSFF